MSDPAAQAAFEHWLERDSGLTFPRNTMGHYQDTFEMLNIRRAYLAAFATARQQQAQAITKAVRDAVVQEYPGSDSSLECILAAITRAAEEEGMSEPIRDKIAFELDARGFHFVATYLVEPNENALIEITKDGQMVKSLLWPAYKIWNIAAHADDIAQDLEAGLREAGSTGFGGNVYVG